MTDTLSLQFDFSRYPYLLPDGKAVGGNIRTEPADFQVDEVLEAPPTGEGEFLLVRIEKTGLTTRYVVDHLRLALGLEEAQLRWAGLKDRHAVTTQWLSLPAAKAAEFAALAPMDGLRVLEQGLNPEGLHEGALAGNRFRILLRNPGGSLDDARGVMTELALRGVPNYFGPQRFGMAGDNAARGLHLIRKGRGRSKRWLDKLLINSLQSFVFNEWLGARLAKGLFDTVIHGDIAIKHASGGKFLVGDPETEAPRAAAFEISASGPLFGKKYHEAQFEAQAIEDGVLQGVGLTRADFVGCPGTRRPIRLALADWSVEEAPEGLWVSFSLPPGAYATAVLRELMHADPDPRADAE